MPKTMTKANQKRLLACCSNGNHVFLVYRHGNPKDVFRGCWLTTDPEIQECSSYDFRVDKLIEGCESKIDAIWKLKDPTRFGCITEAALVLARLEQAIADGKISFPPDPPAEWQDGYPVCEFVSSEPPYYTSTHKVSSISAIPESDKVDSIDAIWTLESANPKRCRIRIKNYAHLCSLIEVVGENGSPVSRVTFTSLLQPCQ